MGSWLAVFCFLFFTWSMRQSKTCVVNVYRKLGKPHWALFMIGRLDIRLPALIYYQILTTRYLLPFVFFACFGGVIGSNFIRDLAKNIWKVKSWVIEQHHWGCSWWFHRFPWFWLHFEFVFIFGNGLNIWWVQSHYLFWWFGHVQDLQCLLSVLIGESNRLNWIGLLRNCLEGR